MAGVAIVSSMVLRTVARSSGTKPSSMVARPAMRPPFDSRRDWKPMPPVRNTRLNAARAKGAMLDPGNQRDFTMARVKKNHPTLPQTAMVATQGSAVAGSEVMPRDERLCFRARRQHFNWVN